MTPTPPADDVHDWFHVGSVALPVGAVHDWAVLPQCGAVVLFSGTVRDHAEGRDGVTGLTYEAWEDEALRSFAAIARELRTRWPDSGRVALLHRTGHLGLGEASVVAAVSAPHRPQAFEAARYAIDALKASAPIWKKEHWSGGDDWGTGATTMADPSGVPTAESTVTWSA